MQSLDALKRTPMEADLAGETRYYTGVPCPAGHQTYRYVTGRACAACVNKRSAESRKRRRLTASATAKR